MAIVPSKSISCVVQVLESALIFSISKVLYFPIWSQGSPSFSSPCNILFNSPPINQCVSSSSFNTLNMFQTSVLFVNIGVPYRLVKCHYLPLISSLMKSVDEVFALPIYLQLHFIPPHNSCPSRSTFTTDTIPKLNPTFLFSPSYSDIKSLVSDRKMTTRPCCLIKRQMTGTV